MSEKSGLGINWVNSAGSALAAVSAAVVLSTLGTAGTLIGAAMGSLVITVGGALYSRSIQVTKERAAALAARRRPVGADTPASAGQSTQGALAAQPHDQPHHQSRDQSRDQSRQEPDRPAGVGAADEERDDLSPGRGLAWKRIATGTVALFVVAMGLIVGFEVITDRPVSSWTGGSSDTEHGTSIPGTGRSSDPDQPENPGRPEPTLTGDPTPTEPTSTDEPTETPEVTETPEPTETADPTAPATPTPPNPGATPTAPPPTPAGKPTG